MDRKAITNAADEEVRRVRTAKAADNLAQSKLSMIDEYGDDHKDGTVLAFRKRFEQFGPSYSYAAIRANGRWYMTGGRSSAQGCSWAELVDWLVAGEPVDPAADFDVVREGPGE